MMRNNGDASLPSCDFLADRSRVTIDALRAVAAIFLLISQTGLVVSQEGTSQGNVPSNESIMSSYGFPFLSGLKHLCQERVYADDKHASRHITWDAFSSSLEPSQVVKFFRHELGDAGFNPKGAGGTWRFPVGSAPPDRVLTVLSVKEEGPHSNCKEQIPAGAKSVLILSRKR